ncbi:hypothetical protein [Paenibacillus silviterrae]|uniref:hypothetical protein n=1 Tax=Paenibacillus silviterrae TaxID=3242194 RepID=UPI002543F957|nr:hypothetical protein [Paenibacillus chinjuensis]
MRSILWQVVLLSISVALSGCAIEEAQPPVKVVEMPQSEKTDEETIIGLVESFGSKLQMVSLSAPNELISKNIQENYGNLVSQELLTKWQSDPVHAPGRQVSSPWPDRIEVQSDEKVSNDMYRVKGQIIEITSSNGIAAKRTILAEVKKINNRWLITNVELGTNEEDKSVQYVNTEYGFHFPLPDSWKGFAIVTDEWKGLVPGGSGGEKVVEKGPFISIRHPLWKKESPRQDIPIMIFTHAQWNSLQQGKFHIGAAPIGPSELGRNSQYVFALPARYNFAFPTGYEEVESILNKKPLQPMETSK